MPNYGLVVNSSYNPLSYEQYAAPFKDYAKVYNEMADAYDTLEMQANVWEKLAESEKDADVYAVYKKYADDLRSQANDLATKGLSTSTRGSVSQMRKRYFSEIQPIEDAWKTRESEIKMQQQARLQNPTVLFDRDAAQTGLKSYMAGSKEFQTYTGDMLKEQASKMAKNLSKEIRDDIQTHGKSSNWYSILGGQYYEKALKYGLSSDDILAVLEGGNNIPALTKIYSQVLNSSGIQNWKNFDDIAERALGYIQSGFWDAIGETKFENLANKGFIDSLTRANMEPQDIKLWGTVGQDVEFDSDVLKASQSDLDFLNGIVNNGIPQEFTSSIDYGDSALNSIARQMEDYTNAKNRVDPNWDRNTDASWQALNTSYNQALQQYKNRSGHNPVGTKKTVANPDYERLKALAEKYNVDINDITTIYNSHLDAHDTLITVNKYTYLNDATSKRLMRFLGNQTTAGIPDADLNKYIYFEDEKGNKTKKGYDPVKAREILNDPDSIFQVNFYNGKIRIHNTTKGTYYLDPSVLRNLDITTGDVELPANGELNSLFGVSPKGGPIRLSADNYIKAVTEARKVLKKKGFSDDEITANINVLIEYFYRNLKNEVDYLHKEQSVTGK